MTQAIVYKLTTNTWAKVFPKVVEGIVGKGNRVIINTRKDAMSALDDLMWSFEQLSFLPHGTTEDESPESQPVLIADDYKALNGAKVLAVTDSKIPDNFNDFERIISVYDQANIADMDTFLNQSKQLNLGTIIYQQDAKGVWAKVN